MEQKEGKKINEWRKNRSKRLKEMKKRKKTDRNENKLKRRQERKTMTRWRDSCSGAFSNVISRIRDKYVK